MNTSDPQSPRSTLSVSVVIPVYNGGKAFEASLASVAAAVRPGDEIIVVADGESDGAWRISPKFGASVILLEQNGGPGRARNHGAKAAKCDLIFFVDADVTIRPNAIALIESVFLRDPQVTAMIGSYDEEPYHKNFLSQYKNLLHHYVHQQGPSQATTFWGACGIIRRKIFIEMGGFKETYLRASIEDIELGYRLYSSGYTIRIEKTLQVTHLKRWTPWGLIKTEILLRGAPWTRLLWKQLWRSGQMTGDLNLDFKHKLSLIISALIVGTLPASFFSLWFLVATLVLSVAFLILNAPVLRFFHEKRGFLFAAGVAFWRFIYDLYSWVGFFSGSSGTALMAMERLTAFTFAKLDAMALGIAVGVVAGLGLFVATGLLLLKGGEQHLLGQNLNLLGHFLPGFRVSWPGALVGLIEAFAVGFGFGWFFAVIRNFSVRIAMGQEKVGRALSRIRKKSAKQATSPKAA